MEAEARHDFNATASDELSFSRGDIIKVSLGWSTHTRLSWATGSETFTVIGYL